MSRRTPRILRRLRKQFSEKIYELQSSTHRRRRDEILKWGKGELLVAMFISRFNNEIPKKELISHLEDNGYTHDGAVSTIFYMIQKGNLVKIEHNLLCLKTPMNIVIKKQVGHFQVLKLMGISLSGILLIVSYDMNIPFLFALAITFMVYSVVVNLDDFLNTTPY